MQQDILACFPMRSEWDALHPPVEEPYPAPRCTSREYAGGMIHPAPVPKLAEFAREVGWDVRTQYAQGYPPHGSTGRPGALKDSVAICFGNHPLTDRQAYACYEKTASGSAWSWNGIMIRGSDLPPFAGCGVENLKVFLLNPDWSASAVAEWVRDLKTVRAAADEATKLRAKERAKTAMPKSREGMS